MYVILVNISNEDEPPMWVDEGYSTTEEEKETDLRGYEEVFGKGRVKLMRKDEWEAQHNEKVQEETQRVETRAKQDNEYKEALRNDRRKERQEKKEGEDAKKLRPGKDELRKRRLQYFDFQNRRYTRAAKKRLGNT